jgi:hypothetical protein
MPHEWFQGHLWLMEHSRGRINKLDDAGNVLAFFQASRAPEDLDWQLGDPRRLRGFSDSREVITWALDSFQVISE